MLGTIHQLRDCQPHHTTPESAPAAHNRTHGAGNEIEKQQNLEFTGIFPYGAFGPSVCAACFNELAEKAGIAYSFEGIEVTSWSDRGAPSSRRGSKWR
jgi:hypothetical protein